MKRIEKVKGSKTYREMQCVSLHFDTQSLFTPHLVHSYRNSSPDASVDCLMDV